jgi:hypothetical protein
MSSSLVLHESLTALSSLTPGRSPPPVPHGAVKQGPKLFLSARKRGASRTARCRTAAVTFTGRLLTYLLSYLLTGLATWLFSFVSPSFLQSVHPSNSLSTQPCHTQPRSLLLSCNRSCRHGMYGGSCPLSTRAVSLNTACGSKMEHRFSMYTSVFMSNVVR